jgi:D-aspartate ligase
LTDYALLFRGDHYGTLAAMRSLGSVNVHVTLADSRSFVPAAVSKFMKAQVTPPPFERTAEFISWLDDFGKKHPNCFLYPVNDISCWLFALHGERLRVNFNLPYPNAEVIRKILFKPELNRIATSVGIKSPQTWIPKSEADVASIVREPTLEGFVIKPKTQLGQRIPHKGYIVKSNDQLLNMWRKFGKLFPSQDVAGLIEGDEVFPMIQRYVASSAQGVFSVAGYINQDGSVYKTIGAVKILQRPARMGIGLCFEHYTVDPALLEKLRNLCMSLGYFGLFEVEFLIDKSGEPMIIDFNCRYYSQIGFDIKRGLDLVQLVYTNGKHVASLQNVNAKEYRYGLSWYLLVLIFTQFLKLNWKFVATWSTWLFNGRGEYIDKVTADGDRKPLIGDIFSQVGHWILHPRSSFKALFDA